MSKRYAGRPTSVVMDNARYQRCKVVQELADQLGIRLLFLPSYSPNLNLIERLWKFVKKKCLYNVYYETFEEFKEGINSCLKQIGKQYKREIATLMNPEFQNFKNYKLLTA